MSRRAGAAVAGALVCAAAGCIPGTFRAPAGHAPAPALTAAGSVAVVAAALQAALADAGVATVEKREAQEVRLVGVTGSREAFALRLTPVKAGKRDRTAVAVQWGREPDELLEQTIRRVLVDLEAVRDETAAASSGG
jgi:hypothetical protein